MMKSRSSVAAAVHVTRAALGSIPSTGVESSGVGCKDDCAAGGRAGVPSQEFTNDRSGVRGGGHVYSVYARSAAGCSGCGTTDRVWEQGSECFRVRVGG